MSTLQPPSSKTAHRALHKLQRYTQEFDPFPLLCAFGSICLASFRREPTDPLVRGHMAQPPLELMQALILHNVPNATDQRKPTKATVDSLSALAVQVTGEEIASRDRGHAPETDELSESQAKVRKNIELSRHLLRHNGFPQQIVPTMQAVFSPSDNALARTCKVTFSALVEMLDRVVRSIEDRYRTYVEGEEFLYQAKPSEYSAAVARWFPSAQDREAWLARMMVPRLSKAQRRRQVVAFLNAQLSGIFILSLADFVSAYSIPVDPAALRSIIQRWALPFGALQQENPVDFILDNPVWRKPLVALDNDTLLCPFPWLFFSFARDILQELAEAFPAVKDRYTKTSGHALTHFVAHTLVLQRHFHVRTSLVVTCSGHNGTFVLTKSAPCREVLL